MKGCHLLFALSVVCSFSFIGCYHHPKPEHAIKLHRASFSSLPGWQEDNHWQALVAFKNSCQVFARRKSFIGNVAAWQEICTASTKVRENEDQAARRFFEFWFIPYHVCDNTDPQGLFTGYYLPTLKCSLSKRKNYPYPIYALPDDWVRVDLGLFAEDLKGRTLVGQVKEHKMFLYPTRQDIARGRIGKQTPVLAWCNDKIALAFAQIQGSARVVLPNNKQFLIGYAGSNGHPYTALGKVLIKRGALTSQNNSMQAIRAWLLAHSEQIDVVLDENSSYVFFRKLDNDEPLGCQQSPLTAERSLAIDKKHIPLGVPIWLNTVIPRQGAGEDMPWRHLLITQDTGGAIKGIVRGDVYWGEGERAEFIAGHMKSKGEYWLLLPRALQQGQ